jgi:hypothetical protein
LRRARTSSSSKRSVGRLSTVNYGQFGECTAEITHPCLFMRRRTRSVEVRGSLVERCACSPSCLFGVESLTRVFLLGCPCRPHRQLDQYVLRSTAPFVLVPRVLTLQPSARRGHFGHQRCWHKGLLPKRARLFRSAARLSRLGPDSCRLSKRSVSKTLSRPSLLTPRNRQVVRLRFASGA